MHVLARLRTVRPCVRHNDGWERVVLTIHHNDVIVILMVHSGLSREVWLSNLTVDVTTALPLRVLFSESVNILSGNMIAARET